MSQKRSCWICQSKLFEAIKPSNISNNLDSSYFAITDMDYGKTGTIYRCNACGFRSCLDLDNVLCFYESMEDKSYEAGREQRGLQAKNLLQRLTRYKQQGRLLDIGAGSGILVEQALHAGYSAEGIEPSVWLHDKAESRGLCVHRGTLPHPDVHPPFDIVTLIDVIEHVSHPVGLLADIAAVLDHDGIGVVVTPNVDSIAARVMGHKWWHYRIAHIGYFNKRTLTLALNQVGLRPVHFCRPRWYFSTDYLASRINNYLPRGIRVSLPDSLGNIAIPLNLFDSILCIFKKN